MRIKTWAGALLAAAAVSAPAFSDAATLRVMPLGDSITEAVGWYEGSGYRAVLRQLLTEAGYEIDYVGSNSAAAEGFWNPAISNPTTDDIQHEGHSGWRVDSPGGDSIREHLPGWFRFVPDPHVILIHLGTNDLGANWDDRTLIDRYDAMIDELAAMQPSAMIIATTLLPRTEEFDTYHIKPLFNDLLEARVAAHVAKGQKVYFLDMYSKLERGAPTADPETGIVTGDFPDFLHPNERGFRKMAQAWFEKIREIVPAASVADLPENEIAVVDFELAADRQSATFYFNRQVGDGAADLSHYQVSSEAFVPVSAVISADRRSVRVQGTFPVKPNIVTKLTATGVPSLSGATSCAARSYDITYNPYGPLNYVREATLYRKVYELDIPENPGYYSAAPLYSFNDALNVGPFARVAYYLELEAADGTFQWAWASMDAPTGDPQKIGVPTRASGAWFWQTVDNLHVYSNVSGVETGERGQGKIEFWPRNYEERRSLNVEGASDSHFDVDDTNTEGDYGSMQIHDLGTLTPVICFNHWGAGGETADIGIGPSGTANTDWTFTGNAGNWTRRRNLQVYVLESTAEVPAPQMADARVDTSGRTIYVTFDSPVSAEGLDEAFTLSGGIAVRSAVRDKLDHRRVTLGTDAVTDPASVTLTAADVCADAPSRTPGTSARTLAYLGVPDEVAARVDPALRADYELVWQIDLPCGTEWHEGTPVYTLTDWNKRPFDRVAYYLQLVSLDGSATNWVWVSADAFTAGNNPAEIAFPYLNDGATGHFGLSNIEYASNVGAVTAFAGATGGVAELCGGNYTEGISDPAHGGSDSKFDWNDTLNTRDDGHGAFQFFALRPGEGGEIEGIPLLCVNGWATYESSISLGIGPSTSDNFDWTFAHTAPLYSARRLYAFVRPKTQAPDLAAPAAVTALVPAAATGWQHLYTIKLKRGFKANNKTGADMTVNADGRQEAYEVDNSYWIKPNYARVGYLVELEKTAWQTDEATGETSATVTTNWVWTAFDRFSQRADFTEIDLPSPGVIVACRVANLDVDSNVPGVATGTGIETGNIEFWPYDYHSANESNIPGANGGTYDFGDACTRYVGQHGSWQVHNYGAQQTIWAVNQFNTGDAMGVGIGNAPDGGDWTFSDTISDYSSVKIYVLVKPDPDAPELDPDYISRVFYLRRAVASDDLARVCVTFTEAPGPDAARPSFYTVDGAAPVRARLSDLDDRDVILTLAAPLSDAEDHSVTTLFPNGANGTLAFKRPRAASEDVAAGVDEFADYVLANDLTIGTAVNYSANGADYRSDLSRFCTLAFDRIAYSLELESNEGGDRRWAWVSFDANTDDLSKLGVPTALRNIHFAGFVQNLKVYASANANVQTGAWPDGNVEITPSDYGPDNVLGIPGADGGAFDFGDNVGGDERGTVAGHGCFQIHNYRELETVITVSQTGKGGAPGIGIGTQPGNNGGIDGTFDTNAQNFRTRELKAYVRLTPVTGDAGNAPQFLVQPQGRVFSHDEAPTAYTLTAYAPAAARYQWRRNGVPILGATGSTLTVDVRAADGTVVYDVIAYIDNANYGLSAPASVRVRGGSLFLFR